MQMAGEREPSGACDTGIQGNLPCEFPAFFEKRGQSFLDIGIMPFIIRKQYLAVAVNQSNFYSGGTDVDSETVAFIHSSGKNFPYLLVIKGNTGRWQMLRPFRCNLNRRDCIINSERLQSTGCAFGGKKSLKICKKCVKFQMVPENNSKAFDKWKLREL